MTKKLKKFLKEVEENASTIKSKKTSTNIKKLVSLVVAYEALAHQYKQEWDIEKRYSDRNELHNHPAHGM